MPTIENAEEAKAFIDGCTPEEGDDLLHDLLVLTYPSSESQNN